MASVLRTLLFYFTRSELDVVVALSVCSTATGCARTPPTSTLKSSWQTPSTRPSDATRDAQWMCNPVHKHRELRGLTSAGKSSTEPPQHPHQYPQWLALLPHSKKVLGSSPDLSVWSWHVLAVFVWVSSGYSGFLPHQNTCILYSCHCPVTKALALELELVPGRCTVAAHCS